MSLSLRSYYPLLTFSCTSLSGFSAVRRTDSALARLAGHDGCDTYICRTKLHSFWKMRCHFNLFSSLSVYLAVSVCAFACLCARTESTVVIAIIFIVFIFDCLDRFNSLGFHFSHVPPHLRLMSASVSFSVFCAALPRVSFFPSFSRVSVYLFRCYILYIFMFASTLTHWWCDTVFLLYFDAHRASSLNSCQPLGRSPFFSSFGIFLCLLFLSFWLPSAERRSWKLAACFVPSRFSFPELFVLFLFVYCLNFFFFFNCCVTCWRSPDCLAWRRVAHAVWYTGQSVFLLFENLTFLDSTVLTVAPSFAALHTQQRYSQDTILKLQSTIVLPKLLKHYMLSVGKERIEASSRPQRKKYTSEGYALDAKC